jgi:hypothetical protein
VAYGFVSDRKALARAIAARTKSRRIEIPRERRTKGAFHGGATTEMRGGMTAEEYRWPLIHKFGDE